MPGVVWISELASLPRSLHTSAPRPRAARWDFSYLLGIRFDLGPSGSVLEIADRHWSDAWIKRPNRRQDFLTLSVAF